MIIFVKLQKYLSQLSFLPSPKFWLRAANISLKGDRVGAGIATQLDNADFLFFLYFNNFNFCLIPGPGLNRLAI